MIKVIILEDEPAALQRLKRMLKDIRPEYTIIGSADNIADAHNLVKDADFDLILSDIELSDGTCFEVFEKKDPEKPIIFITAYNDYAIKAFDFNGIHYLLKPINYEALTQALVKFEKNQINLSNLNALKEEINPSPDYQKRIISKVGNKLKVIETKDIFLVYTDTGMVYVKTFDNTKHIIDETLENLYHKLNPDLYFRINRQMIININAVESMHTYSSSRLKIKPKVPHDNNIVVSKEKTADFKKWISSR